PVVDAGRAALAGVDDPGPVAGGPVVGPLLGPPIRRAHPPDPAGFPVGGGAGAGAAPVVVVPHRGHRRPSPADQLDPADTHGAGAELGGGHARGPHRAKPRKWPRRARMMASSRARATWASRSTTLSSARSTRAWSPEAAA